MGILAGINCSISEFEGLNYLNIFLVKFHSMPANYDQHIDVEVSTCESQCWGHTTLSIQIRNESSFI